MAEEATRHDFQLTVGDAQNHHFYRRTYSPLMVANLLRAKTMITIRSRLVTVVPTLTARVLMVNGWKGSLLKNSLLPPT